MEQRGAPNAEARALPAKRLKMEMIPGNASPATRAASAFDLESDEVPDEFKCPICQKVPLAEVFQCRNSHVVCNMCHGNQKNKMTCVKCKADMKTSDGEFIRCRALENVLNALWIACPYKSNGCPEVLSWGQVENHRKDCVHNGNRVQLCKYFGRSCDYWSCDTKPEEALRHFTTHSGYAVNFLLSDFHCLSTNKGRNGYFEGLETRQDGDVFFTPMWETGNDNLSFACIQMNRSENVYAVELTFEAFNTSKAIHQWKLRLPATPLRDAPAILEHKPVSVSRAFLVNYLFRDEDDQKINLSGYNRVLVKITAKIY